MAENYGETVNVALLRFMGPLTGAVLDIGCGTGSWARNLRDQGADHLVGLEPSRDAEQARKRYDVVITTPIEKAVIPAVGTVIAADVLEHLVDPWAALSRVRASAPPGSKLYVSVPNAQFIKALLTVAAGRFPYDEEGGYWDRTHLRWFTRSSLTSVLHEGGWKVERSAYVVGSGWRGRSHRLTRGALGPWLGHQLHVAATAV